VVGGGRGGKNELCKVQIIGEKVGARRENSEKEVLIAGQQCGRSNPEGQSPNGTRRGRHLKQRVKAGMWVECTPSPGPEPKRKKMEDVKYAPVNGEKALCLFLGSRKKKTNCFDLKGWRP